MYHGNETIVAQCSPSGAGALALIRLSGSTAVHIATCMSQLSSGKKLADMPSHTIHYGAIIGTDGAHVDQVLFLLMRCPRTFTGEDTVEISCHNNPFIIESIIELCILHGARIAQNGEFTKQAVLNNKLDLLQAEGINELIQATSQQSLKKSLAQLKGSLSSHIAHLETLLTKALALSEASFEFLDEEHPEFKTGIIALFSDVLNQITTLKATFHQHQQIRQGIKVALCGGVNVGKSSLFNALIGYNRAIVTEIAGTTRDTVEAGIYKNGHYVTLIDTAGIRSTSDMVEQEGIKRSLEQAHQSDIILLVYDGSVPLSASNKDAYAAIFNAHKNKVIVVRNKTDLPIIHSELPWHQAEAIAVSSTQGLAIPLLKTAIDHKINSLFSCIDNPYVLNKRQFNVIVTLEQQVRSLHTLLQGNDFQFELISQDITETIATVSELTGKSISEAGMDAVFREFCVGK